MTLLKANTQLIEDYGIDIDTTEETAVTGLTASEESFDDESETEGDISESGSEEDISLETDDNEDEES